MRIDGGCHCGRLTFEAEVDPGKVGLCHCTDCQTFSGAAYSASVAAAKDAFQLRGEPKTYVKTGDSGRQRVHAFCPECGTRIYAADPVDPPSYSIRIGTIRQRAQLGPVVQIWCGSALPWAMDLTAVPQLAGQPKRT